MNKKHQEQTKNKISSFYSHTWMIVGYSILKQRQCSIITLASIGGFVNSAVNLVQVLYK